MEYWINGVMGRGPKGIENNSFSQYSSTPIFQYSTAAVLHHSDTPALFFDNLLEEFFLFEGHFASPLPCPLVFMSDQMENTMDH